MLEERFWQRISIDPRVMTGNPVVKETRVPVELIVRMLAQGVPDQEILQEYPRLEPDGIRAALANAAPALSDAG